MRKIRNFCKILAKWIFSKFVAEKAQRDMRILRELPKLKELRKIAIFVKFVAERKIVRVVVVFNSEHTDTNDHEQRQASKQTE